MKYHLIRFAGYFTYTVLIGYILFKGTQYQKFLDTLRFTDIDPVLIFSSLFPISIGMLLALPRFIHVFKKQGSWQFDWIKFLAIGLPAFYLTISPITLFPPFSVYFPLYPGRLLLMYSMLPQIVSGITFGYLLLGLLHKKH